MVADVGCERKGCGGKMAEKAEYVVGKWLVECGVVVMRKVEGRGLANVYQPQLCTWGERV